MYSKRHLPDIEQWSQSSGSNVIPRRARPVLAGLRPHPPSHGHAVCAGECAPHERQPDPPLAGFYHLQPRRQGQTLNPKPQPETRNPNPETLNPKPQT